jgi:STE24 endopeptidase
MNPFLTIIIAVILFRYLLEVISDRLNLGHISEKLPPEFEGSYDADKYSKSQQYLRENTEFDTVTDTVHTGILLAFIIAGGFNAIDRLVRMPNCGPILTGIMFAGVIMLGLKIINLPFSIYHTFVIEERYGFNKTTPRTFTLDLLKAIVLTALLGGVVLAGIIWFFEKTGNLAWLYCWLALSAFQVIMLFIAPYVIMPLFNKFEPLEEGELRSEIENYAAKEDFKIKGVFTMDGSRRSAKSNAFFTGFGKSRRIVLFDTLIEKHTVPELTSVVAHEMGHCKKKHILSAIVRSVLVAGLMFYVLSFFITSRPLFDAFSMKDVSIHAGLFFFGFLFTPISMIIGIIENAISRKHEYEADQYVVDTYGNRDAMISALKKLTVNNLGNLAPHPLKIFLSYTHPPVLDRIRAISASALNT